ncbi:VQ motif-containing protein 4 [Humulus lupulus]|uniref:VQ motif-containing protein 4 n=1 Tax=Humulus lupulus TaxID=3486 RepID=UPI002B402D5F|nr:VQ motif-containing protein 4 [Humulus lupulus]
MEISPRHQLNPNSSYPPLPSPNSHSTTSTTSSSNSNGVQASPSATTTAAPPLAPHTPKPITRSESTNPYPTTFVQADTSSFKQVVQMLTGSTETAKQASSSSGKPSSDPSSRTHIPPVKSTPKKQQQSGFKLYERRNSLKNLKINPLIPIYGSNNSGFSPRKPEILSPSILDFPSLVLSPVTPLIPDPFDRSGLASFACSSNGNASLDAQAEEKAIKEKGFYLHRSPATTPRDPEPRLLPLFPTTSPRAPGSSLSS